MLKNDSPGAQSLYNLGTPCIIFPELSCQNKHLEIWDNVGGQKYEIILLICCKFEGECLDLPIFD